MKKVLKILGHSIFIILTGIIVYINIGAYFGPNMNKQDNINRDVITQLNYIEDKLENDDLAYEMQRIFPEGYVFTYALYGLTWCELAKLTDDTSIINRAIKEAQYSYDKIDSDFARFNFDNSLNPEYGVFYCGWKNYLLGKLLSVKSNISDNELVIFSFECDKIAKAFESSSTPYLESYYYSTWPADAFLAIASLKIYDEIVSVKYDTLIATWINKVKQNLDPETKLIPHSVNPETGETIEGARGSSISLILRILLEIDKNFAVNQFEKYDSLFNISKFGFPAIREYPIGKSGKGDIDSGPVIFDVGFAATIVSIGTYKSFGEYKMANFISNTIETFGLPFTSNNKKRYLFGQLPIADAFICWSRISSTNNEIVKLKGLDVVKFGSKFRIHLFSLFVIIIISLLFYRKRIISYSRRIKIRIRKA